MIIILLNVEHLFYLHQSI